MERTPRPVGIRARRTTLILALLFVAGIVSAQSAPARSEVSESPLPLKAEMTGIFTGNITSLYVSADPSVVWKPGVFAAGIGAEVIIGMSQFDMYLGPYLRLELAWFHLDAGYILALLQPPDGDGLAGFTAGIAAAPKPIDLTYGVFGFELALDWNIDRFVQAYGVLATSPAGQRITGSLLLSGRLGLGVTYSFDLL